MFGGIGDGFLRCLAAAVEIPKRLGEDIGIESVGLAQADKVFGLQLLEAEIGRIADRQGKLAKFRVERSGDKVVGGREPQPVGRMEHREVLEVRIGVARQKADKNALR